MFYFVNMKWITRERPKIDRLACPWLIKRFIDPEAEFVFVPYGDVLSMAETLGATPFDIPGVEYSHHEDRCTFDYFLRKHQIKDIALDRMAAIIRGADTDRHDFAPQAAGLEAIFSGLAYNNQDDQELLSLGMIIYDGLYSWAQFLHKQTHTQGHADQLLLQVYHQYLKQPKKKQAPEWAKTLREMIQDQLDTHMSITLQQASAELEINPAYLSREFSKYFDNLSFGDYMRKMRIEKACTLIETTNHSLTEIAYLTGFSDQAHFSRIFKQHMGANPSAYKKNLSKK